jgi:hypothetical protein
MKYAVLGLVAASLVATPVLAWKTEFFNTLDTDANGLLSVVELEQTGCRVNKKLFAYANTDKDAGLSKNEFFGNRDLFRSCK